MADKGGTHSRAMPYVIGGALGVVAVAALVLWVIATNPGVGSRAVGSGPRVTSEDLARWDGLSAAGSSSETRNVEAIFVDRDSGNWATSADSLVVPLDESLRLELVVSTWLRRTVAAGSTVNAATRLLSAHVDGGRRAYVNLSSDLLDGASVGLTAETEFVIGLAKTIRANMPTVVDMQLLVDGQEADSIGGQLDISSPLRLARFAEME